MYDVSGSYRHDSVSNFSQPDFSVELYDDWFEFSGAKFGTGTFGTQAGFVFYNINNERKSAEIGTSYFEGGMNIINDGTRLNPATVVGDTWGTWTSPILTPYYKACWDKIKISDYRSGLFQDPNLLFLETFETYNGVIANGGVFDNNGTIGVGIRGNSLKGTSGNLGVYWKNNLKLKNGILEREGEISFKADLLDAGNFKLLYGNSGTLGLKVEVGGDGIPAIYFNEMATFTNIGTIGIGTIGNITFNWKMAGTGLIFNTWVNGYWKSGTVGTFNWGSQTKTITGETKLLDDVFIFGSQLHGSSWTGNASESKGGNYYQVRYSDDGTNFTNWADIGSNYLSYDKFNIYSLVGSCSNYAQFRIILYDSVFAGGYGYVNSFAPHCTFKLDSNQVIDIGAVDYKLENDRKIGLIEAGNISAKLSNASSKYFGKDKLFGDNK